MDHNVSKIVSAEPDICVFVIIIIKKYLAENFIFCQYWADHIHTINSQIYIMREYHVYIIEYKWVFLFNYIAWAMRHKLFILRMINNYPIIKWEYIYYFWSLINASIVHIFKSNG